MVRTVGEIRCGSADIMWLLFSFSSQFFMFGCANRDKYMVVYIQQTARDSDDNDRSIQVESKMLPYCYSSEEETPSEEDDYSYSPLSEPPMSPAPSLKPPTAARSYYFPDPTKQTGKTTSTVAKSSSIPPVPALPKLAIPQTDASDSQPECTSFILSPSPIHDVDVPSHLNTPIEVATPITYCIPSARPSVIHVPPPSSKVNTNVIRRPTSLPHPPRAPAASEKRVSVPSVKSLPMPSARTHTSSSVVSSGKRECEVKENSIKRQPPAMPIPGKPILKSRTTASKAGSTTSTPDGFWATKQREARQPPSTSAMSHRKNNAAVTTKFSLDASTYPRAAISNQIADAAIEPDPAPIPMGPSALVRKRRSSIGQTLRNTSSILRGITTPSKPSTWDPPMSTVSRDSLTPRHEPLSSPTLAVQPVVQFDLVDTSRRRSRLRSVRSTIGV